MAHFNFQSEENYLKALFKLNLNPNKKATNIGLSKELGLNPATVLEMVRKLIKKKLVRQEKDKSLHLTDKGRQNALKIIRKHRLWEVFLVDQLKFKWNQIHDIAEQLEHTESEELIDRLDAFLNYPKYDPHGDPIPDKNGNFPVHDFILLNEAPLNKPYYVMGLAESENSFLDYLTQIGISIGCTIKIAEKIDFDNSLNILLGREKFHISKDVAKNILVSKNKPK